MDITAVTAAIDTEELSVLSPAVRYLFRSLRLVRDADPAASTPCPDWKLGDLLRHLHMSFESFADILTIAQPPSDRSETFCDIDLVSAIRNQVVDLIIAWTALPNPEWRCEIEDRTLPARAILYVAALEMVVHGWDVAQACGARLPIPHELAEALLPEAVRAAEAGAACKVFAAPIHLPAGATAGQRLLATLGRRETR